MPSEYVGGKVAGETHLSQCVHSCLGFRDLENKSVCFLQESCPKFCYVYPAKWGLSSFGSLSLDGMILREKLDNFVEIQLP